MKHSIGFLVIPLLLLASDQPWKDKRPAEWSDDEVRQVLSDSPWARPTTPEMKATQRPSRSGMGRRGGMGGPGIGIGGIGGIGFPGGGRRGGYGGPTGGPPPQRSDEDDRGEARTAPHLIVRWESALPVQEAELKAKNADAPGIDEGHYAIVVLGIPNRMVSHEDSGKLKGELRREGSKDIKSVNVRVIARDDGPILVYLFPRSKEITQKDRLVTFSSKVGPLEIRLPFVLDEMMCQGKLEL
jgi:hypothetical protein